MTTERPQSGSADQPGAGPGSTDPEERLSVELEDAASRKWWARILYTLGSQYGRTPLRFVGRTGDGRRLYVSDTFPGPPLNATPPEEAWAPGMQASLQQLCEDITRDGWSETGRGLHPWDLTFSRRKAW